MAELHKLVVILKSLSDETRFKIISLLLSHNYCVRALANRLQISEAAVSQHLQILRKSGLVKGEKKGYWTHYIVQREVLNKVADDLKELAAIQINKDTCTRSFSNKQGCCCNNNGGDVDEYC